MLQNAEVGALAREAKKKTGDRRPDRPQKPEAPRLLEYLEGEGGACVQSAGVWLVVACATMF